MSHTIPQKQKLLARVRHIEGQVEAVEWAFKSDARCDQVMHLIAGTRGAIGGMMVEVFEDHVRSHLVSKSRITMATQVRASSKRSEPI